MVQGSKLIEVYKDLKEYWDKSPTDGGYGFFVKSSSFNCLISLVQHMNTLLINNELQATDEELKYLKEETEWVNSRREFPAGFIGG